MPRSLPAPDRRRTVGLAAGLLAGTVLGLAPAPAALAAEPPEGGRWYETWIETADGETLHVDVIRGEDVPDDVRQPVVLIASPYLGLAPDEAPGPSNRFFDLIEGADLLEDYTVVQVSLRGTGGSSGCLDILGPGEQEDVRAAVEFAATADFSTGGVGMYGKSYDANTGGLALATRPEGLDAVVAQQIAVDRYRGSYNDRVRLLQSLVYPSATYGSQGEAGFSLSGDPQAIANSLGRSADCQVLLAEHYLDDESLDFWRVRDFVERAEGSDIPAIITTGYLDNPTNVGAGAVDLFNQLTGPKHLWIGWWDHVRGNDTVGSDRLAMGREDWFGHVRRFFDHHVRGLPLSEAPTHLDPVVAAQGSDGLWRAEDAFPAADTVLVDAPVLPGSYQDDGANEGSADPTLGSGGLAVRSTSPGNGSWTFSEPLARRVHLAGIPTASIEVSPVVPRTNVVVNLYDVDEDGRATMITRGAALVDAAGSQQVLLYPTDWTFEPGHRVGILVSGSNAEHYTHVPTDTTVAVDGGTIGLPLLPADRPERPLPGDIAPRLESYLASAPFDVPVDVAARTAEGFVVEPPAGRDASAPAPPPTTEPAEPAPATEPATAPLPATGGGLGAAGMAVLAALRGRRRR